MSKERFKLKGNIIYHGWFIWVAFFAVIQPDYIVSSNLGARILNYINMITMLILVVDMIRSRKMAINIGLLLIFSVQFCLVFSSIYNSANVEYSIKRLIMIMDICIITNKNLKNNADDFIRCIYNLLFGCIAINFVTILLFPDGLYYSYYEYYGTQIAYLKHWFLSAGNNFILFILPAFLLDQIRLSRKGKYIDAQAVILYVMSLYGIVNSWAVTSLIACVLFLLFVLLMHKKGIPMPSLKQYAVLGLAIFLLIVVFNAAELFSGFLAVVLKSDVTFTGRTRTWMTAIEWIKQQPIIGYGYEYAETMVSKFDNNTATHCHNLYLDLCYRSGIVSLVLFIRTLFKCSKPLAKYKTDWMSIVLSFTIFIYLGILFQMEAYFNLSLFYVILIFGFNIEYWIEGTK